MQKCAKNAKYEEYEKYANQTYQTYLLPPLVMVYFFQVDALFLHREQFSPFFSELTHLLVFLYRGIGLNNAVVSQIWRILVMLPNQTKYTKSNLPYQTLISNYKFKPAKPNLPNWTSQQGFVSTCPVFVAIWFPRSGMIVWCERGCVAWKKVAWFFKQLISLKSSKCLGP